MRRHMNTNFGAKANNLIKLKDAGFSVPEFYAVSANDLKVFSFQEIANKAHKDIGAVSYAVRSSALIEDSKEESFAGQFSTKLAVQPEDLVAAMEALVWNAKNILGSIDEFGLIIQKFIEPDVAGVVFTRDPQGNRELTLEFVRGRGENLVSGKKNPKTLYFYRNSTLWDVEYLDVIQKSIEIELLFGFPQDIEWCQKEGRLWILQSRPITTITKEQNKINEFLDKELPNERFFYEKNLITEVAPSPTELTWELLNKLYEKQGPVDLVYKKHNIEFQDTNFLLRIGGQLYVDKEKELHSLFPAMTFLHDKQYRKTFGSFSGFWTSYKNMKAIRKLSFDCEKSFLDVQDAINFYSSQNDLEKSIKEFLQVYEIVFEINLGAADAIGKLSQILPADMQVSDALSLNIKLTDNWLLTPPQGLLGNSLEVYDSTEFTCADYIGSGHGESDKYSRFRDEIANAQKWQLLREYGRWLMLSHINGIKKFAKGEGKYRKVFPYELPARLYLSRVTSISKSLGLSSGIAWGRLVTKDDIEKISGQKILFSECFTPDLVEMFDKINGIVTHRGGLLSHAAIVARESGIPVILNEKISRSMIGKNIEINGGTGSFVVR